MSERAAIVDLRDFGRRRAWQDHKLDEFLASQGLVPDGEVVRRFEPPRVLLVVCDWEGSMLGFKHSKRWLADVEHLVVVRIDPGIEAGRAEDPELAELLDLEWAEALEGLQPALFSDPAAALARARDLAHALPPRESSPVVIPAPELLPVTPWREYDPKGLERTFLERIRREGREIAIVPAPSDNWGTKEEMANPHVYNPGQYPLGSDPLRPNIGWRGARMFVYWTWKGRFVTESDHDFPCGPSKKLYGYDDNHPLEVTLAPDLSMYAAHFEHDVLVTRAVPIPWQRAGDFDVHVKAPDPYRAVFFAQDPDNDEHELLRPADELDENARDRSTALVLMPGGYAVDLSFRVFRITKPQVDQREAERALVGGPDEGYAIFDAEHRLLRRGRGQLLGGWYRFATIADDGVYWREDLVTGERERLAPVDFTISDDPAVEAVARDAMLEGDFERARELRAAGPARSIEPTSSWDDSLLVYALPQTKNVLLVSKKHAFYRVI